MRFTSFFAVLLVSLTVEYAESARVLGVFPLAGKSLKILYNRLMRGLADAGHDVTVISAYENKLPVLNGSYKDVVLTGIAEYYEVEYAESARVLGVFPLAGKSLNILYNRLMRGLADAGHDVTVISAHENKIPVLNGSYRDVVLTGIADYYEGLIDGLNLLEATDELSIWTVIDKYQAALPLYNKTFSHPNLKKFLKSNEQFDLVITDYYYSESLAIFAHIYKCPSVIFQSLGGIIPWVNDMVGNSLFPSYVPHFFFTGDYSEAKSFFQRVHNSLFFMCDYIFKHYHAIPVHNQLFREHFQNPPDLATLYHNISLVLLGSHMSLQQPISLAPNMIEIGGFHIDPPKKLPNELQDFLDDAKDGAIYFSMGSHLKSSKFSNEKKQILVNVFSKLKQRVIWKFEDDELPGQPPNLLIKKWLPQMDVLAHPNIKLFITHGGFGSTLETIYLGVPTLMIPVFVDQFHNANKAVEGGFALKLSCSDKNFNEKTIYGLIQELLGNPKYKDNAMLISKLFHDRPNKPLDTAIYWIEYVIRHKGADHLKLGGRSLPWYQYYIVDVILFLISSVLLALYILYVILKLTFRCLSKSSTIKLKES